LYAQVQAANLTGIKIAKDFRQDSQLLAEQEVPTNRDFLISHEPKGDFLKQT